MDVNHVGGMVSSDVATVMAMVRLIVKIVMVMVVVLVAKMLLVWGSGPLGRGVSDTGASGCVAVGSDSTGCGAGCDTDG